MTSEKFERGILTKADREFLRNPEEYSRQASFNREKKIRERLQRSLLDIPILVQHLDSDLLTEAVRDPETEEDPADQLPALISLLYQFYGSEYQLERAVGAGVERIHREQGAPVKARVSIDLFPDELAELKQRFDEDGVDAVDDRELEDLWNAGELDDDEYITLVKRWQDRWEPDRYDEVDEDPDVAEYEREGRRRVVHGAVNRAKLNVDRARRLEESRREAFGEPDGDPQRGEGGPASDSERDE